MYGVFRQDGAAHGLIDPGGFKAYSLGVLSLKAMASTVGLCASRQADFLESRSARATRTCICAHVQASW